MSSEPLVSVIINCFNGGQFVKDSIGSVLKQKYKNWEIIFWDNVSSDNTFEEVKKFVDPRIKYFIAEKHTTLYEARNLAIEKSSGEFIAFLDVDDWWEETKLQNQILIFSDRKDIGLIYSNFYKCDEINGKTYVNHNKILPSGKITNLLLKSYNVGWLTVIIRKSFYEKLKNKFNSSYNVIGDFDLIMRLSTICNFHYLDQVTGYCRWHGKNLQIVQQKKHLNELNFWVSEMENYKGINDQSNFHYFKNNLLKMKLIYFAKNDFSNFYFTEFFKLRGFFNKFKVLLFLFVPKKILKFF
jgi:glycosyltransferase involved in cell wall biosynthesis